MKNSAVPETRFSIVWNPLMLALIFFIVFVVSLFPQGWHDITYSIAYTLLIISAVLTMSKNRWLWLSVVLVIISAEWISSIANLAVLDSISKVLNSLFFAFMAGYYIHEIAKAKQVTASVIFQAIIGYLLLGLVCSILIALLVEYDPAMFNFPHVLKAGSPSHFSDYIYFGFVTMTTLGYGDILPLLPFSKSLSILISVSGQLYLAIIIAMLVGKYASQKS